MTVVVNGFTNKEEINRQESLNQDIILSIVIMILLERCVE